MLYILLIEDMESALETKGKELEEKVCIYIEREKKRVCCNRILFFAFILTKNVDRKRYGKNWKGTGFKCRYV